MKCDFSSRWVEKINENYARITGGGGVLAIPSWETDKNCTGSCSLLHVFTTAEVADKSEKYRIYYNETKMTGGGVDV